MGITATLSEPYYTGGSISSLVPAVWPIAINGRPYMLDTLPETFYVRWNVETIPLLRQQADQSDAPAEQSLNPSGFWRRAQDSFHHGAGQVFRDRDKNADAYRYRASKGIDVWTRYQCSLLPDTDQKVSTSNTNLKVVSAGARLYLCDGTAVKYTTDVTVDTPSLSTVTGTSGQSVTGLASDGFNIYIASGTGGIYLTDTASTAASSWVTGTVAGPIAYVKGRVMAANANSIYNPTTSGALPTALFTHGNTAFTWVGFAEGTANIYAAGYAGDKSLIYRIAVKPDATTLDAPIVAGELPDGEVVASIGGYLGFVFLGTSRGVRFCEVDGQGNLTIGPVIETGNPVLAFEPQDRFMWFGWTAYDSVSTGLGRIDLTQFVDTDQPAYASDLMCTGSGAITSIASFQDLRVFAVSGAGIYAETSTLVTSGTLTTGESGFGLPDPKTAIFVHTDTEPLSGSLQVELAGSDGAFVVVGTESDLLSTTDNFPANNLSSERFEVRITLTQANATSGPTFLRWTLKVIPTTADGPAELFHIPIMLYPTVRIRGLDYPVDVEFERKVISDLRATRQVVEYQQFNTTYTGIVVDFKEYPYGLVDAPDGRWSLKSTLLVDFQRVN